MKKAEFRELLLANDIVTVTVTSFADGNGGRQNCVGFNKTEEEAYDNLRAFAYVEWHGTASDAVRHRKMVFEDHFEPFHEEAYDFEKTLEDLILEHFEEN
jgi:hypothetical protein